MWYGLYDTTTGDLRSIGSDAMFASGQRPKGDTYNGLAIADFGEERPDLSLVEWDPTRREMVERPPAPPQKTDADLLIEALATDQAWTALSRSQQTALEAAIRSADERKHRASEPGDEREALERA